MQAMKIIFTVIQMIFIVAITYLHKYYGHCIKRIISCSKSHDHFQQTKRSKQDEKREELVNDDQEASDEDLSDAFFEGIESGKVHIKWSYLDYVSYDV